MIFFFSSRRRHTRCALVTGVQTCALPISELGFDEINLNCGCPSDRVQAGRFGACLMREPALVAGSVAAMIEAVSTLETPVPITVKCRLGVDDDHRYEVFRDFVDEVAGAGCRLFVVHARNAWLKGLSPKEDRKSEEHTSELQSLIRISYAVSCLQKKEQYISTLQRIRLCSAKALTEAAVQPLD